MLHFSTFIMYGYALRATKDLLLIFSNFHVIFELILKMLTHNPCGFLSKIKTCERVKKKNVITEKCQRETIFWSKWATWWARENEKAGDELEAQ